MQKTDIRELRKQIKKAVKTGGVIDWIYGAYVSGENEIQWENLRRFYDMTEEEQFRHVDLITKTLPSSLGKDLITAQTQQNDYLLDLRSIRTEHDTAEENLNALKDVLKDHYTHTDPYYFLATKVHLDVVERAADGTRIEDGANVYEALVISICPAKLSAPALGYTDGEVGELSRRWTVSAPVAGFLYPSFDLRAENRNEAALFSKKGNGESFFNAVFEFDKQVCSQEMIRESWTTVVSGTGMTLNETCIFNQLLLEKREESEETTADRKTLRKIAEAAGCDGKKFEERYAEVLGETEIPFEMVSDSKCRIVTDSAKLLLPAEQAEFVKIREVDGIPYLLVPLDGQIQMNGIAIGG